MPRVSIVFGTRPEAIKLAPVITALRAHGGFDVRVLVTGQQREMLDQVLRVFAIRADRDLAIMHPNQDLFDVTTRALTGLHQALAQEPPDVLLVQGDTTTTFAATLAAFYLKVPVGHVEAGLRTGDKYRPFPEEVNRRLTTVLADYHFAPTEAARVNLIREGVPADRIWITGNTGIDALLATVERQRHEDVRRDVETRLIRETGAALDGRRLVLVTGHRRESFGEPLRQICLALRDLARRNPDLLVVYPVHLNPNVRRPVFELLDGAAAGGRPPNLVLADALDYDLFVYLLSQAFLVLTDSGGIQEEAPSLGKPVLVMRETTERPEPVEAGVARLVGANRLGILAETERLLHDSDRYRAMARPTRLFGDGTAAECIVSRLASCLGVAARSTVPLADRTFS